MSLNVLNLQNKRFSFVGIFVRTNDSMNNAWRRPIWSNRALMPPVELWPSSSGKYINTKTHELKSSGSGR